MKVDASGATQRAKSQALAAAPAMLVHNTVTRASQARETSATLARTAYLHDEVQASASARIARGALAFRELQRRRRLDSSDGHVQRTWRMFESVRDGNVRRDSRARGTPHVSFLFLLSRSRALGTR